MDEVTSWPVGQHRLGLQKEWVKIGETQWNVPDSVKKQHIVS